MRLLGYHDILNSSLFDSSSELQQAWIEVRNAINLIDWPRGSGTFTIYSQKKGNGVRPIKGPCIESLQRSGWETETLPEIQSSVLGTGDLDALKSTSDGDIAFEWETGNISSSHRALNKLFLGMQEANILGGFLVVPGNELKKYLTDRIGNIGELEPYFPLWRRFTWIQGALRIVVVEYDELSDDSSFQIPKGRDGMAQA